MYFGYTFCPDVCPTDVQNIGAAMRLLDKSDPALSAAKIVPIFVSVDPARDTPAVLKQFVAAFHPRMVGLTGSAAAIAAVAKEYRDLSISKGDRRRPMAAIIVDHSRVSLSDGPGRQAACAAAAGRDRRKRSPPKLKRWVR